MDECVHSHITSDFCTFFRFFSFRSAKVLYQELHPSLVHTFVYEWAELRRHMTNHIKQNYTGIVQVIARGYS